MTVQDQLRLWAAVAIGGLLLGPPRAIKVAFRREDEVPGKLLDVLTGQLGGLSSVVSTGAFGVLIASPGAQPVAWQGAMGSKAVRVFDRLHCEKAALPALCTGRLVEWDAEQDTYVYLGASSSSSIEVVASVKKGEVKEIARRETYRSLPWDDTEALLKALLKGKRDELGFIRLLFGRDADGDRLWFSGAENLRTRLGCEMIEVVGYEPVVRFPVTAVMHGVLLEAGIAGSLP